MNAPTPDEIDGDGPAFDSKAVTAPLPSGVITLVFTDIEGSTQQWERHPAAFRGSLDTHNSLLREVLARWDGHEVKSQGDSFMLAFERATSAIYFAVDLQRELRCTDWNPETGQPQVRIGIHTGEPFRGYDAAGRPDYFGPMVNRSARIADAGHGGQILLSASTRDVAAGALSTDVEVVDLGFHRLRGIEQPEQIFEVRHPELFDRETGEPRRYPPLRTSDPLRSNLPIYSTSFVGRVRELPELCEVLNQRDTRLLTIIGFGGMGKTRLTLQLAERCRENFPDGAWWIALDEVWNGEAMIGRIAYHVGLQIQPEPSVREQLLEYLRPRQLLLVLDNVEQVPDAAQVISELLAAAPQIKCVVTSRRALDLQVERIKEIHPLPAADATSLFVDRACAQMQFQLTTENAADIAELCRRVEGIPLAIELAASRATTLSPREIVDRLDERFQILSADSHDLPLRQRALSAAIDWSYSLLTPEEQHLFAQMAIFTGGFSLADAEAVCDMKGEEISVFDGVTKLRANSLLRSEIVPQTQQTRYFMLEALRDYAHGKLVDRGDEAQLLAQRHAEYFLEFAQKRIALLRGAEATRAVAELEHAFDNLRAATDWTSRHDRYVQCARLSLALGSYLQCRGFGHDALRRLQAGRTCLAQLRADSSASEAISLPDFAAIQGALLREIAGVHLDHFHWQQARETAQLALQEFEQSGDRRGVAQATNLLGLAAKADGNYNEARDAFSRAIQMFQQENDRIGEALALNNLGLIEFSDVGGNASKAHEYWQQALAIHRELDDRRGIAQVLTNLGALAQGADETDRAWGFFIEALRWERELHHTFGVARTLSNLGEVAELRNDLQRAHRLYSAAQCLFRQIGSPYDQYVSDLLARIDQSGEEEWVLSELREKSLDDLVRWSLERVH